LQFIVESPDGTRLAYRAFNAEGLPVVRRVDLLTSAAWDTMVTSHEVFDGLAFGLFLGRDDAVQAWICDGDVLRVYADLGIENPPLVEFENFPCDGERRLDPPGRFLVSNQRSSARAIDLVERREHLVVLDPEADAVRQVLGGEALAGDWHTEVIDGDVVRQIPHVQALFATRTGKKLADRWEPVPTSRGFHAANRLGSPPALITADASGVVVTEGLRGIYVFADLRRAFAVRSTSAGAEVVFVDIASGEISPIASGVPANLKIDDETLENDRSPHPSNVAASPFERSAWLKIASCTSLTADCRTPYAWVRWKDDGSVEHFAETTNYAGLPWFVAEDGAALFAGDDPRAIDPPKPAIVVSSTGTVMPFPFEPSRLNALNSDGRVIAFEEVFETPPTPEITSRFVAFDPQTAELRELTFGAHWEMTSETDLFGGRLAFDLTGPGPYQPSPAPREVWAGRFPSAR
jgi:hypothetical protein